MRNLKKFLALVLAMMMVFSLMITANATSAAGTFGDEDQVTEKFAEAVDVLSGIGIMIGNDGNFNPAGTLTRAEAATIMYRVITGDVEDERVGLYTEYGNFADVKTSDWFSGYVGYCANHGIIQGDGAGNFLPYAKIDGYQMLAMLLRAIGYQNLEVFSGSDWRTRVASGATQLGILDDINDTRYGGNLYTETRRDVVASMTFQAIRKPQVIDNGLGSYTQYKSLTSTELNDSLGRKWFGLSWIGSAIVGNKATGEKATRLGGGTAVSQGDKPVRYDDFGYPIIVKYESADREVVKSLIYRFDSSGAAVDEYDTALNAMKNMETSLYDYLPGDGTAPTISWEASMYDYVSGNWLVDFETGLDQFAHQVKVWFNNGSRNSDGIYHAYALIDQVKSDEAFYAKDNDDVGDVAGIAAAKKATTNVKWSDRFSQIGTLAGTATTNLSPISTYRKVVNPNATIYIALSAEVADVAQVNTTAKDPYLILGKSDEPNATAFMNDATGKWINLANLTSDTKDAQKKAGELVTAYEVLGTSFKLTDHSNLASIPTDDPNDGTTWLGDIMYKLEPMVTKTLTVKSFQKVSPDLTLDTSADLVVGKVTPTEGDALELSGITLGDGTNSKIISRALPIVTAGTQVTGLTTDLKANITYTAYIDIVGRFISMVPADDYKFLYGTYADYVIGGMGTGTIAYNMVGVDWNAKIQGENPIKSLTVNGPSITGIHDLDGTVNLIDGTEYNKIGTTKKDQGQLATAGNEIQPGADTGYMYNATTGDLALWEGGRMTGSTTGSDWDSWSITAQDARNGFVKVTANSQEYLLTKDTHFIVVTGTGTATLKVEEFTGLTALLNGSTNATISYDADGDSASENEVNFLTSDQKYGTMYTGDNGVITDVILSDKNLSRWSTENLYLDYNQTSDTGVVLPGTDPDEVKQYELWCNGKMDTYFIDITLNATDATDLNLALGDGTDALFFTLAQAYDVNGTPVYRVTKAKAVSGTDGIGNTKNDGFSARGTTYKYITVSDWHSGLFNDGTDDLVLNMDNVTVCDAQWKAEQAATGKAKDNLVRSEITTVLELNNAVSVGEHDNNRTYTIKVAVVYNTSNASAVTVYVLGTT